MRLAQVHAMSAKNVVSAFTVDEVERLTGVSKRQLGYWDKTDFFVPGLAFADGRRAYSRLYSFRDVVSLKVINALRNNSKVPLPHLREVKDKLRALGDEMWSKTTLYVLKKKVVFVNPETDAFEEVVSGQGVLQIPLMIVSGDMSRAVDKLRKRDPASIGKFERRRNVAHNQEVIAGTRIPVRSVKAFSEAGYTVEEIRAEYPTLTEDDIRAAIAHEAAA
jgi:uncharacterized protein (DUF433 family)/DNA-binding transcriptional MerR regulator